MYSVCFTFSIRFKVVLNQVNRRAASRARERIGNVDICADQFALTVARRQDTIIFCGTDMSEKEGSSSDNGSGGDKQAVEKRKRLPLVQASRRG